MNNEEKEAVEQFWDKTQSEGLAYAIEEYPPSDAAPEELKEATAAARAALTKVRRLLGKYEELYGFEPW